MTKQSVSAWGTGRAEGMLAENLFYVADKLGVEPRWLATGEGSMDPKARGRDEDLIRFVSLWAQISYEGRLHLVRQAEFLLQMASGARRR